MSGRSITSAESSPLHAAGFLPEHFRGRVMVKNRPSVTNPELLLDGRLSWHSILYEMLHIKTLSYHSAVANVWPFISAIFES